MNAYPDTFGIVQIHPASDGYDTPWGDSRFSLYGVSAFPTTWTDGRIERVEVLSKKGHTCRIDPKTKVYVTTDGKHVKSKTLKDGSIEFSTRAGKKYTLTRSKN